MLELYTSILTGANLIASWISAYISTATPMAVSTRPYTTDVARLLYPIRYCHPREGEKYQNYEGRHRLRTSYVLHYTTPDILRLACQRTHDECNKDIDKTVLRKAQ